MHFPDDEWFCAPFRVFDGYSMSSFSLWRVYVSVRPSIRVFFGSVSGSFVGRVHRECLGHLCISLSLAGVFRMKVFHVNGLT